MPKRKSSSKIVEQHSTKPPKNHEEKTTNYGVTFVNLNLLSDDKTAIRELAEQEHDYFYWIERWVLDGYKFSLGFDKRNETCTASITGKTCIGENVGYCLTAKHREPHLAILALYYKHYHLCADGIFPTNTEWRSATGDFE